MVPVKAIFIPPDGAQGLPLCAGMLAGLLLSVTSTTESHILLMRTVLRAGGVYVCGGPTLPF